MHVEMNRLSGNIVAGYSEHATFTVLRFRQGENEIVMHLDPRMTAVTAMIVEAFNAHATDAPIPTGGSMSASELEEWEAASRQMWSMPVSIVASGDDMVARIATWPSLGDDDAAATIERRDLP